MSSILISIIARDGNGPLRIIADRKLIEHSDDHAEINRSLQSARTPATTWC
jgi:hypothetical protein